MVNKKIIWAALVFLLILPIVSADPPVKEIYVGDEGLEIIAPTLPYFRYGGSGELIIHVANKSNGVLYNASEADCRAHLMLPNGSMILNEDAIENNYIFNIYFNKSHIPINNALYSYTIHCNTSNFGGQLIGYFEVNDAGDKDEPLLVGLIMFLLFGIAGVFGVLAFKLNSEEHYALKFSSLIIGLFFVMMSIQYALIAAQDYVKGNLSEILGDFWFIFVLIFIILITYLMIWLTKKAMEYWKSLRFR